MTTSGPVVRMAMQIGSDTTADERPKCLSRNTSQAPADTGIRPDPDHARRGPGGADAGAKSLQELGFITAVETADHGIFGGYLTVRPNGRPLEFFCTSPVEPSRAQQVLYGPTLRSFLLAECIGAALVRKAARPPAILLTDLPVMLDLRAFIETPMALVGAAQTADASVSVPMHPATSLPPNGPVQLGPELYETFPRQALPYEEDSTLVPVAVAQQTLFVPALRVSELRPWTGALADFARRLDLSEPFERIRLAIDEARRVHDAA